MKAATQNSVCLESELNTLEQKRDRLQSDLEAAERAHQEARRAVVQVGDQPSLEAVTAAYSRMTALTDALSTLETQITEKREAFREVAESERRDRVKTEIATKTTEREQARLDYLKSRERANEALKQPVEAMFEAAQRFSQAGDEIKQLYASIGIETQRPSDRFGTKEIQPFGYEVDQAYMRLIRISAREAEEARAEERRSRRLQQRPAA